MTPLQSESDELVEEADQVRAQLFATVKELDQRRHEAIGVGVQVERSIVPVAAVGAGLLIVSGGAVLIAHYAFSSRAHGHWARLSMLKRLWEHPERAARKQRRSILGEIARNVLIGLATSAVLIPARRALARFVGDLDERQEAPPP